MDQIDLFFEQYKDSYTRIFDDLKGEISKNVKKLTIK
jgi:hypothetical protein